MLSLARASAKRVVKPFSRGFAQETTLVPAHTQINRPATADSAGSAVPPDAWRKGKIPVKEDHGLYAFFRRKGDASLKGEDAYDTVESAQKEVTGRAWRASELRLKGFKDLHTLWYITLRERNVLASQREEARKAGVSITLQAQTVMAGHCRKTMARIKAIMNERRIAYQGAVELYTEHKETVQDKQFLELQHQAHYKAYGRLVAFQKKGRTLRRERAKEYMQARREELEAAALETESAPATELAGAPAATPGPTLEIPATIEVGASVPTGTAPQSTVDTAAAGLFGGSEKK